MGILFLIGALLTVVGVLGAVTNLAIPAWRPRGPRRDVAVVRLVVFAVLIALGAAAILYAASNRVVIYG